MNRTLATLTLACSGGAIMSLAQAQDVSKGGVEWPIKKALAPAPETAPETSAAPADRRVKPGDVPWHRSFDDAVAAAKDSGKPVFVFQLLGQLDQEFC